METSRTVEVLSENRTAFLEAVRTTTLDYWIVRAPSVKARETAAGWVDRCLIVFLRARLFVRRVSFNSL